MLFATGIDLGSVATGIGAVLTTGVGVYFLLRDRVIASQGEEIKRLGARNLDLETRMTASNAMVIQNQLRIAMMEGSTGALPVAMWEMSLGDEANAPKYLWVNAEFERVFLITSGHDAGWIIGKTHAEAFGDDLAKEMGEIDDCAAKLDGRRAWKDGVVWKPGLPAYMVMKVQRCLPNGRVIGVMGFAISHRNKVPCEGQS